MATIEDFQALIDKEVGLSDWLVINGRRGGPRRSGLTRSIAF
jgi:hypothetical protein